MKTPRTLMILALLSGLSAVVSAQDRGTGDKDKKDQPPQPKDVIFRVSRDLQTAEERLGKSDPGDVTRKIQRDIIDGLDELIKQNQKSESNQSSSSKMKQQSADRKKKQGQQKDQSDQAKDENKGKGEDKDKDKDKDGEKKVDLGLSKNDKSGKPDAASDLFRMDWGHLPETKRLEMDAYSKERFMPRYDEILQQYYRTIAEQGQKK